MGQGYILNESGDHGRHRVRTDATMTAVTGTHCPVNGFWTPQGQRGSEIFIFEGTVMPTHDSVATTWTLALRPSRPGAAPSDGAS